MAVEPHDCLAPLLRHHGFPEPRCASECPPGWLPIVGDLLRGLGELRWRRIEQIKEKFGGLRVYLAASRSPHQAAAHELVEAAVRRAAQTCAVCGRRGWLRRNLRWIQTLCAPCWRHALAREKERPR